MHAVNSAFVSISVSQPGVPLRLPGGTWKDGVSSTDLNKTEFNILFLMFKSTSTY